MLNDQGDDVARAVVTVGTTSGGLGAMIVAVGRPGLAKLATTGASRP